MKKNHVRRLLLLFLLSCVCLMTSCKESQDKAGPINTAVKVGENAVDFPWIRESTLRLTYQSYRIDNELKSIKKDEFKGTQKERYLKSIEKTPEGQVFVVFTFTYELLQAGPHEHLNVQSGFLTYKPLEGALEETVENYFDYFSHHPDKKILDGHNYFTFLLKVGEPKEVEYGAFIPKDWFEGGIAIELVNTQAVKVGKEEDYSPILHRFIVKFK